MNCCCPAYHQSIGMGCSTARPPLVFLCPHMYRNTLFFTGVHRFCSAHVKLSSSYYLQYFLLKASTCRPKVRKFYWFPSRWLPFWSFCLATQGIETTVLLIQPGGKRLQLISSTAPLNGAVCLPSRHRALKQGSGRKGAWPRRGLPKTVLLL